MVKIIYMRRIHFLSLLTILSLLLSFPPFGLYPLAWSAFVPFFEVINNTTPSFAFKYGFGIGIAVFLGLLYWIVHSLTVYGHLSLWFSLSLLFLLVIYLSFYFAIFGYLLVKLKVFETNLAPWLTGAIWTGLEYIRGHLLTGFPWCLLGDSQYRWLTFIQIADIGGIYLLSFLVITANACLFCIFKREMKGRLLNTIFMLFVLFLVLLYGRYQLKSWHKKMVQAPKIKVGLVQGNIDESQKWDPAFQDFTLKIYAELSQKMALKKPQLIVWPETALPFFFQQPSPNRKFVLNFIRQTKIPFLIGAPAYKLSFKKVYYYNRAYLINKKGEVIGHYDKTHLVPFGEYVPLRRFLSFIPAVAATEGDFYPGKVISPLSLRINGKNLHLGILICFEGIFPQISREFALKGANFLINITNDAWFGYTSAPYQHFAMLVFRAIENRRSIVRCANTGFSAFILPTGEIAKRSELFQRQYLINDIPLIQAKSFYTLHGDILAYGCFCVILVWVVSNRRWIWKKSEKI